jgi:hypothetical protein
VEPLFASMMELGNLAFEKVHEWGNFPKSSPQSQSQYKFHRLHDAVPFRF